MKIFLQNLIRKVDSFFGQLQAGYLISLGIMMVVIIGVIDYKVGYIVSFSIFYLIPITFVSWYATRRPGIFIALLSAVIWLAADLIAEHPYKYFLIPFWNAVLRFGFFLIISLLLASIKSAIEKERSLARIDHLTGTWNSRAFYEKVETEIERTLRYRHAISLAYIDLDNFKTVNDVLGHNTGDELLIIVASVIKENIRAVDMLARLGGDEFALLLVETEAKPANELITRIQNKLLATMQKKNWPVTFSIGLITSLRPAISVKNLIVKADTIMYSVKKSGKNAIVHEML